MRRRTVAWRRHDDTRSGPPFHLATPVRDIDEARPFYDDVLGLARGRSDERWTHWNLDGHQLVTHQVSEHQNAVARTNPVDGHEMPVPHFGPSLDADRFAKLATRLIEPVPSS